MQGKPNEVLPPPVSSFLIPPGTVTSQLHIREIRGSFL
jgi:hypothetical protein